MLSEEISRFVRLGRTAGYPLNQSVMPDSRLRCSAGVFLPVGKE